VETQFEKVPSNVQEMPERAEETLQAARERLNETLAGINEHARTVARYADETVHANPWRSLGIGFGVGVLIGALAALAATRR
jgi:ElaB/YqjD/DUF883 family membrane-anchored ribosome-binding protein